MALNICKKLNFAKNVSYDLIAFSRRIASCQISQSYATLKRESTALRMMFGVPVEQSQ